VNLSELKAKNEEEAKVKEIIDPVITDDSPVDPLIDPPVDPPVDGADEPWKEIDKQESIEVPVATHIHIKQKLKGKISERDDKIAALERTIEELKAKVTPQSKVSDTPSLARPKASDYLKSEDYEEDLAIYESNLVQSHVAKELAKINSSSSSQRQLKDLETSVDQHYARANSLVEKSGITPEVYKAADSAVRMAMESIKPGAGDLIVDQLIMVLGEGSEKVLYYVGRNEAALTMVKSLVASDPSGMRAAIYLGQQKQRLTKTSARVSKAPAPSTEISSDTTSTPKAEALLKKYKEAHAKGNLQAAYNLKKEAKAAKLNVSSW